ncbi:Diphthine methyltransferase [Chamberlinius hualienensis]
MKGFGFFVSCFQSLNRFTFDTEWNADCTEWCPISNAHDILVCGTYQLVESISGSNERKGCVNLLKFNEEHKLEFLQKVSAESAILDIKWSERLVNNNPTFVAANAKGKIEMYQFQNNNLKYMTAFNVGNELLLSLDWLTSASSSNSELLLAVSGSSGLISVIGTHSNGDMRRLQQWEAHTYEAWTTAFDRWNSNIVYSGGDDCLLKGWDKRQPSQTFKSSRHTMGVTSIASNPFRDHILATGSYDENILLWDSRNMNSPVFSYHTGGGVWRLKWDPKDGQYLLAACMHHGVIVVDYKNLEQPRLVTHYNNHKSMAYGIDWSRRIDENAWPVNTAVASCSFYDHALHIWTITSN